MTRNAFLQVISKIIVEENKKRKYPLFPSVVIAQAICESNWGQSQIMMRSNAVFGIKAGGNWKGKVYNAKTKECYDGTTYTNISANFRAYNSLEESVSDYFDLITKSSRYKFAVNTKSPLDCITAIKNGGYATSPNYVKIIMAIISANRLTEYDKKEEKKTSKYKVGTTYTLKVDLHVRTGAGEKYAIKKYKDLTTDGKKHALKKTANSKAILVKGTRVTCLKIIETDNQIWLQIPSGFVCANYKGKEYIN